MHQIYQSWCEKSSGLAKCQLNLTKRYKNRSCNTQISEKTTTITNKNQAYQDFIPHN